MYSWRDRERILDVLAMLGGNRVNYGLNTIGGVRRDILPEQIEIIKNVMDYIEEQIKYYTELAMEDATLAARLSGIGKLSHDEAIRFGSVGPVARASNVAEDIRKADPYAAYGEIPFNVITDGRSDVFGRTVVRIGEIAESCHIIRYCLENLPDGDILAKVPRKIPAGEIISRTEAPRGENIHYLRANGTDKPDRIRVRAPSEANWHAMKHMLENNYLADVPIIIAAIDPCYSCTDRAILVDRRDSGKQVMFDWEGLRQYSIEWYKKKGVDTGSIRIPGDRKE
jgi:NADH-quinone oxidoreductase subunit D